MEDCTETVSGRRVIQYVKDSAMVMERKETGKRNLTEVRQPQSDKEKIQEKEDEKQCKNC